MESGPSNHKIDHIEVSCVNIWSIVYASFWSCVNLLGLVDVQMQKEKKSYSLIKMPLKSQKRFPLYLGYVFRVDTWKNLIQGSQWNSQIYLCLWFLTIKVSITLWTTFGINLISSTPQKSSIVCYILQILVFWKIVEIIRSVYLYMN